MKLGHIYYMHDSTESTEDSFTLSASAYEIERRSLPFTISVTVIPVNDEPPKLTRNTGLEVAFFFPLLTRTCSVTLIFKFSKNKKFVFFPHGDFSIIITWKSNQAQHESLFNIRPLVFEAVMNI